MASLGQELKRERELRGITLKEISASTKISQKFLKALEDDQPEILPGKFFIKGILRSYAMAIGLDGDYVLNKYYEEKTSQEQTARLAHKTKEGRAAIQKRHLLPLLVAVIILGLIVFSIVFITRHQKAAPPPAIKPKGGTAQLYQAAPDPPRALQPAEPEVKEFKDLALDLSFDQETWIQVYADGTPVIDGLKSAGERASVKSIREILINVGNAGGLSFDLNGRKGKPLGTPGEVIKNIRITLENSRKFLLPEIDPQAAPAEKRK
jgi:transcriptional regulator with XRE-family HTH domain